MPALLKSVPLNPQCFEQARADVRVPCPLATDQENEMQTSTIAAIAALAVAATAPSLTRAAEEHRELGPHVHGHGTLNIAVEDKRVSMELEVPGMDIVGFEHDATTDDQKAAVEKAKAQLAKPLAVFKLPAAAGCSVADAKVAIEAEHHHDGDDDDHDEATITTKADRASRPRSRRARGPQRVPRDLRARLRQARRT